MDRLGDKGIREHISGEGAATQVTSPEIHRLNFSCPNQRWQENEFFLNYKDRGQGPFLKEKQYCSLVFGLMSLDGQIPPVFLSVLILSSLFPASTCSLE